jgi:acyl-coenzyme A synthetase/AMP-(fatty) acid ligase
MTEHNMINYEDTYSSFNWERPAKYNFARDVIDRWANQDAEKLAMLWVDDDGNEVKRTFSDISTASKRLSNVLSELGVERGDTIILMLGRNIEWWEVFTASLRMGAIISPGTTQLSAKDLSYRINASGATCVITDNANAEKLDEVIDECSSIKAKLVIDAERQNWTSYQSALAGASDQFETADTDSDENAMCYFTSGTTGYPKMCIHAHSYGIGHQTTGLYWLDLSAHDLHWNISDTGWAKAAWSSYFGPWNCGATIFVHHSAGFSAKRTLELIEQYPITIMCGAPTIYRMLVLEDLNQYKFNNLRHSVGAGEPLNPEIIEIWKAATGITIRDGYGQTETVILCGSFPCIEPRFGSMGKPAPGIDLNVVDNEGNPVSANTEGDIAVRVFPERPQGLFKEYKDNAEKTAETFKGDWYLTGDRAYKDEDGYFWFVSRADDVILSAGYRIGPFEVESALIEHQAVAESAVVSSPDKTRGEIVKAFVILTPGFEASDDLKKELQDHVKSVTAPYKYPRKLEFVESLPKTVSGKIRRIELREQEWKK